MKLTELPSWMSLAPPNWGTAARGKLTADQWMVVCTVHLPISLIRIWGNLRDRRFSLLCNFMDLTSSVQLADQRTINEKIIRDSEMLMSRYLNSMKMLFKDTKSANPPRCASRRRLSPTLWAKPFGQGVWRGEIP